ncbi:fructose-bisphosphate aldolase [Chengkuizengella sediminis]|uniref:fructose-bisphosphate aldolase n=1 Tax=Chengkuizengella sediminis TaxID=1885917 RepID=UPI001389DB82|nr:fructose-bisphosphate aldolase [Chengkuizengella sediminis]NDI33171.1 fructose-bisphosphate aldolase [Chengkuizengella sediminis]
MKLKQILISLLYVITMLVLTVSCNYIEEPDISIEVQVSELSEEEFEHVGTYGLDNPSINDFRKFTFNLEMNHSYEITRKIEFPSFWTDIWKKSIDSIDDKDRYWFGKGHSQVNESEQFTKYYREFVFYSNGLSEEEIKAAFNSINFTISWETKEGFMMRNDYIAGDLIEFVGLLL